MCLFFLMSIIKERLRIAMMGPPLVKPVALARACDVKQLSVSNWLSGKTRQFESANILAAAEFLEVTPEWLATGKEPMRKSSIQNNAPSNQIAIQEIRRVRLK